MSRKIATLLGALLAIVLSSCEDRSGSSAEQRMGEALMPLQVSAENKSAFVLKLKRGFALIVPHALSIDRGRYRTIYSESGDFENDAQELETWEGELDDKRISVKGRSFRLSCASAESTHLTLNFEDTTTGVAVVADDDPRLSDVSQIDFQRKPRLEIEHVEDWMREEGIEDWLRAQGAR